MDEDKVEEPTISNPQVSQDNVPAESPVAVEEVVSEEPIAVPDAVTPDQPQEEIISTEPDILPSPPESEQPITSELPIETPTEIESEAETIDEIVIPEPGPVLDDTGVEMFTIRSEETGDKVYLLRDKRRYWIKNPETLAKLGFYLGKEKRLPFSELLACSEGEPIDLTIPGAIFPWDKPEGEVKAEVDQPYKVWQ